MRGFFLHLRTVPVWPRESNDGLLLEGRIWSRRETGRFFRECNP